MIPPQSTTCECGGRLELDGAHSILWCTACGTVHDTFLDTYTLDVEMPPGRRRLIEI